MNVGNLKNGARITFLTFLVDWVRGSANKSNRGRNPSIKLHQTEIDPPFKKEESRRTGSDEIEVQRDAGGANRGGLGQEGKNRKPEIRTFNLSVKRRK